MNENKTLDNWDYMKGATRIRVLNFQDGSEIRFYDNGYISVSRRPTRMGEPVRVPEAELYYWQVMRNRPEISTWGQIKEAEREDQDKE
jgi:hypothetical protein